MRGKLFQKLWFMLILPILFFAACSHENQQSAGDQIDFNIAQLAENKMLQFFVDHHPEHPILKYAQADLDNDSREDLIVIYQFATGKNQMSVIYHRNGNFNETNAVPAPVSDQLIQFRNIDEKPPSSSSCKVEKEPRSDMQFFELKREY